jgi:hypothetical protein
VARRNDALLNAATVREVHDQLVRLIDAVGREEVTGTSGMVARLEGAIAALDALLGDASRLTTRRTRDAK